MTPALPPLCHCTECGKPFYRTRSDRQFCSDSCRRAFHNRRKERGLALLDAGMEWRRTRRGQGEVSNMLDRFIAEDNARAREHEKRRQAAEGKGK